MSELLAAARASLDATLPATLGTVDAQGMPNVSYLSRVVYVDEQHVALSNQFFRKSLSNLAVNPRATIMVFDPVNGQQFRLRSRFEGAKEDGELFCRIRAELEALATMVGMSQVFSLRSALIFRVDSCESLALPKAGAIDAQRD